jgi:hypothetical protein
MSKAGKVDKQTEKIIQALCEEIKFHNDEFSRQNRRGSFAMSLLSKKKLEKTQEIGESPGNWRKPRRSQEFTSEKDLDFKMDDLSLSSENVEYIEYNDSETSFEDSISECLDESMSEDEAIEAIITAINRMALKMDSDPKISSLLETTMSREQSSINFSNFNSLVIKLLEDYSPGIAVDSWSNAMFLLIIAFKLSDLKQYPRDFFKRYVYDKIVPWVTEQPGGWISAKDDEKVGKVVKKALSRQVSVPVRERSDSSASDYASSPSSLMSWFSFGPKRSRSFHNYER